MFASDGSTHPPAAVLRSGFLFYLEPFNLLNKLNQKNTLSLSHYPWFTVNISLSVYVGSGGGSRTRHTPTPLRSLLDLLCISLSHNDRIRLCVAPVTLLSAEAGKLTHASSGILSKLVYYSYSSLFSFLLFSLIFLLFSSYFYFFTLIFYLTLRLTFAI